MTRLATLRRRRQKESISDQDRETWKALVTYANADPQSVLGAAEGAVELCGSWWAGVDESVFKEPLNERSAAAHQGDVRKLLTWLCTHGQVPSAFDFGLTPVQFLNANAHGVKWQIEDFDEPDDPAAPYFYQSEEYDSLLSPICEFLVGQVSGPKSDDIPVRICERAGCGRFMLPERKGRKRYCSNLCRATAGKKSPEEWRNYMRRYRKIVERKKAKNPRPILRH